MALRMLCPVLLVPLALQSAAAGTGTQPALRDRLERLATTATEKSKNGDHAAAAALFEEAEAVVAAHADELSGFWDTIGAASLAREHGNAVRAGTLGDPCPLYLMGRTLALRAQNMTANDGERERRDAAEEVLHGLETLAASASCPAPAPPAPDRAFVGHYYLSGVMETGSELLLRADGTFEWFMSYGALDQFARGAWGSDGAAVVLAAQAPAKDAPLFTYRETEPWSEAAENELLERRYDEASDRVLARCPSLAATVSTVAAPELVDDAEQATPDDPPPPEPNASGLPADCVLPERIEAHTLPVDKWTGGVGVRIYDMDAEQGLREVQVTLHFADGTESSLVTQHRGLALLPGKPRSPVVGVALSAPYTPGRDQSFTVRPVSSGIIDVTVDGRQLVAPPFQTLRLRIDGKALIPDWAGRGRYERQP